MDTNEEIIELPVFGINMTISHGEHFSSGSISYDELEEDDASPEYRAALDGLTSMILACACAGVDVQSPPFLEAIETSVNAICNNYLD